MKARIQIELEYNIPNDVNVRDYLENIELPENYVEDSFAITKVNQGA